MSLLGFVLSPGNQNRLTSALVLLVGNYMAPVISDSTARTASSMSLREGYVDFLEVNPFSVIQINVTL